MDFDRPKFKELVLLMAYRSADDLRMSRVKLNKLLYRADTEAYRILGAPITGETYIKGEHGPMARDLPLVEEELGRAGLLRYRIDRSQDFERKVPHADEADQSLFSEQELTIISRTLAELAEHGARSVSRWSHEESAGWRMASMNEPIPYATALLSRELPDDEVAEYFQKLYATR